MREAKEQQQGGGPKKKNDDEVRDKLSSRLYTYFLTTIIPYYNYSVCVVPTNTNIQANKDIVITQFKDILINIKLKDIICVVNRITYYYEIILYRAAYLIYIFNNNIDNINNNINKIHSDIKTYILTSSMYITDVNTYYAAIIAPNGNYIAVYEEEINKLKNSYNDNDTTIAILLAITNASPGIYTNDIYDKVAELQSINNIIKTKINAINTVDIPITEIQKLNILINDIIKSENEYKLYNETYENEYIRHYKDYINDLAKLLTVHDIYIITDIIKDLVAHINTILLSINTYSIIEYVYKIALLSQAYIYLLNNHITIAKSYNDILTINSIIEEIKIIYDKLSIDISNIIIRSSKSMTKADYLISYNYAYNIINYNFNLIFLVIKPYIDRMVLLNIIYNDIDTELKNKIKIITDLIYGTEINILDKLNKKPISKKHTDNKFISLFTKQNDIETNITQLYKNHNELKKIKAENNLVLDIQEDVYPSFDIFFKLANEIQPQRGIGRATREINIAGEAKPLIKKDIANLYSELITIARKLKAEKKIESENPKLINFTTNGPNNLLKVFDIYFRNVNKLGSLIPRTEGEERTINATQRQYYNPNIIIQDMVFISTIASHFKELIKYKNTKIFDIISSVEKDNEIKMYSEIINNKRKNYYNNNDYKIITLVYAGLYNIIKVKHDALMAEKEKARDKYNFIGFYGRNNIYGEVEKLFGVFDLIIEITKSTT
jgi:hypothetical protein